MIEQSYTVKHQDTTMYGKMRTSALFSLMTDMLVEDMERKGAGVSVLLKKNTMLIAVRVYTEIARMPEFGETVNAKSWAGRTRSVLFPRFFTLTDGQGRRIVSATALWTLADTETRHFVFPKERGVSITGDEEEEELRLPPQMEKLPLTHSASLTAPFSYIDINGHLSNMHYFDVVENTLPDAASGLQLKKINVEYSGEILPGSEFSLSWGEDGNRRFITGSGEKRYFSMNLEY